MSGRRSGPWPALDYALLTESTRMARYMRRPKTGKPLWQRGYRTILRLDLNKAKTSPISDGHQGYPPVRRLS